jgi:hypothetical protein
VGLDNFLNKNGKYLIGMTCSLGVKYG